MKVKYKRSHIYIYIITMNRIVYYESYKFYDLHVTISVSRIQILIFA